jgi:hypothetical protein
LVGAIAGGKIISAGRVIVVGIGNVSHFEGRG